MESKTVPLPDESNSMLSRNNVLQVVTHPEYGRLIIKRYKSGGLSFKMIKHFILSRLGFNAPIEYRGTKQRRDFEHHCLTLWRERGYRVPRVIDIVPKDEKRKIFLCLEYIEGERLDRFFLNEHYSMEDKYRLIYTLLAEMSARHCHAIFEQNHMLIHYDANIRNMIVSDGELVYIDFEMGHLNEHIDKSALREVKKLTLQILNLFGKQEMDKIIELLVDTYKVRHILQKMIKKELKRPFNFYHLKRDMKHKKRNAELITKIDLVLKLNQKLNETFKKTSSPVLIDSHDPNLIQSIETSWDGKFYQSLDDRDNRGRNMLHRYEIMQIPECVDGKTVLDIGCNIGRICLDTKRRLAARTVGLDNRKDVVDAMSRFYKNNGYDIELYAFDVNNGVEALQKMIGTTPFDYVFALSIWSHVDATKLWNIINTYCRSICWFEDNSPSRVKSLDQIEQTLKRNLHFSKIEFMGFTSDRGVRAVYRLTK